MLDNHIAAFLIGIAGAGHCLGMCGGISSLVAMGTNAKLLYLALYNVGRIFSYAVVAGLLAWLINTGQESIYIDIMTPLRTLSGVILILTGLYLLNVTHLIIHVEKSGKWLWRLLAPMAKKILPINSPSKSFIAGLIWGWLPCGLVYSTVLWSLGAATHGALSSATLLVAFGMGTLPAMLLTGVAAKEFKSLWQRYRVNYAFGTLLIIYGCWSIPLIHNQISPLFN